MVTKSKGLIKSAYSFFEKFDKKRGSIIGLAIEVENYLANLITWCFFPQKFDYETTPAELIDHNGIALKSLLLDKITFQEKIEMLPEVIQFRDKGLFENNSKFIKNIVKELNEIRIFRNKVAHLESQISFDVPFNSKNTIEDCIQVIDFKHGKEQTHIIDRAKFELEIHRIQDTIFHLHELFSLFSTNPHVVKNHQENINKMHSLVKTGAYQRQINPKKST